MSVNLSEDSVVEVAVRLQIEKLFAAARDVRPHECAAYIMAGETAYVFGSFRNGYLINETEVACGRVPSGWQASTIDESAVRAVETIKAMFPNASSEQVIWRAPPRVEHCPAFPGSKRLGFEPQPAWDLLYFRMINTPVGV